MTVYLIDYYRPGYVNGITTYIDILTKSFSKEAKMTVHVVYVAAMAKCKCIITAKEDGTNVIYVPFDLAEEGVCNAKDEIFANFIANQQHDKDVILHLNWMNHASFALLRRNKVFAFLHESPIAPYRNHAPQCAMSKQIQKHLSLL